MKQTLSCGRYCVLIAALATASACVSLEQPYLEKKAYAIEVTPPEAEGDKPIDSPLRVRRVKVAKPFADHRLIVRRADGTFEPDFYKVYVTSPGDLLTTQARRFLEQAGPYTAVLDSGTTQRRRTSSSARSIRSWARSAKRAGRRTP